MKKIKIFNKKLKNQLALVDDDDYLHLSKFKWYLNKGYAIRVTSRSDGKRIIKMHREVFGALDNIKHIDHIDRNKLNNQKENLRYIDQAGNNYNRPIGKNNTSGHIGISWHKKSQSWQAYIVIDKKFKFLGLFKNKKDAIYARSEAQKQILAANASIQDQEQTGANGEVSTEPAPVEAPSGEGSASV